MERLALERGGSKVDEVTAHATRVRGRTPCGDAESPEARRGEGGGGGGLEEVECRVGVEVVEVPVGKRVGLVDGSGC